jgi:dTDP-4-dehydrorhamnose 3,5-epimerase
VLIHETPLPGAYVLKPQPSNDERGFFARMWCAEELAQHGLNAEWVQSSISFNEAALTLRGMHYQVAPHEETKLVRCTSGAVFDVIVDLREDSTTFRRWFAVELNAQNNLTLYVPPGFAHGFLTLEDGSVLEYHMSESLHADSARGVRWDDPAFGIQWPSAPEVLSASDAQLPTSAEARQEEGPC